MEEMKKKYQEPEFELLDVSFELLAGSTGDDSSDISNDPEDPGNGI